MDFFLRMQGVLVDHNDQELNKPAKDMGIMAGFLLGNRSMGVDCFFKFVWASIGRDAS